MANQKTTSSIVYWDDGKPLSGRRHKIILDTDINLNPKSNSGTLMDGRQVKKIKGKWIYKPH